MTPLPSKSSISDRQKIKNDRHAESTPTTTPEKSFLESVLRNPALSVTGIYRNQKLSAYMGDKIKRALVGKGLIREVTSHLGQRSHTAKFLLPTSQGFTAMKVDLGSGKGGSLHRYWQSVIRFHAENAGYKVVVEETIPGGKESVDLGLHKEGKRLAIEISVTTTAKQELGNARKCLEARYDRIVLLVLEENKARELREILDTNFDADRRSKVSVELAYDFCRFFSEINMFCRFGREQIRIQKPEISK